MSIEKLLTLVTAQVLSDERRKEFQDEQKCDLGFAGLKPVRRVFI